MEPNKHIFELLKDKILPSFNNLREAYFYIKAHKEVNPIHFCEFWSIRTKQLLLDINNINKANIPNHDTILQNHIDLANEVFNDSQTTNPSN